MDSVIKSIIPALLRTPVGIEAPEAEQAWRAHTLKVILLTFSGLLLVNLAIGVPFVFANKPGAVVIIAVMALATACAWGCLRIGRVTLGVHVLVWTLWTFSAVVSFLAAYPTAVWLTPAVFIAATLLGPVWAIVLGLSGITLTAVAIHAVELGLQLHPIFPAPPQSQLFQFAGLLVLTVTPFYLVMRRMTAALRRAGEELAERANAQQDLQHSESRLTLALEAARTGIYEWDIRSGRLTGTPQAAAVYGVREDEFGGTYEEFLRLVHPEDVDRVADFNLGVLEGRMRGRAIEHRIISRGDTVRWVEGRGTLQRNAAGRPERVIGTVVDVTPRKLAEQAMQESETRYRAMIATMAEGTMLRDMEGNLLLCNPAAERIIGLKKEEMGRWSFPLDGWRTIREDGTPFPRDEHPVMITLRTGRPCSSVVMGLQRGDGPFTWISINSVALRRDGEDEPYAVLTTFSDITASRHTQQMLERERILLRTLVDNLPDDIFVIDAAGRYTMVNAAWLTQVGFAAADGVLGKTVFDFFDAALAARFHAENRRVIEIGAGLYNQSRPIDTSDSGKRWILTSKIPMRDVDGQIVGIIGINRDVTELNNALDKLQQERNLLRSIIDTVPDAILVKDRECRYVIMNKEGLHLRGITEQDEVVGKSARDYLPEAAARAHEDEDWRVMNSGVPVINVRRQPALQGTGRRWVSSSKVPLRGADGTVNGMVEVNRDITDLQNIIEQVHSLNAELEDRVRLRTEELQEANKELEAFSYSVSHDLRAPLRSIQGFGNFMLQDNFGQLDAEGQTRLQRILAASARMGELIDDLLTLARISRQSMLPRKVNLHTLAAEIVARLVETSPQRRVEVAIAPDLTVNGDTGLMRVVLENLLGNAWKFTGKRADARIELGVASVDGKRAYFVRDNGAGFDMGYAGKLFAPFQRMHTQQQFEGTGIGLATVKRIIERHHGRVWIESAVDCGTTVFFAVGAAA